MPMGPSGTWWCRLLLIALLLLPIPAVLGLYADDGWTVLSDPAESDENRFRLAAGAPCDSGGMLPTPASARRVGRPEPCELVVSGWASLSPTDRAPPRA
jgi:hypothetical protein